ncbi:MAG: hypothetical protein K6F88_03990 [Ruminococcus sp.]|nr:hypothetical protein [Ruminococcus sp.]
MEDTYKKELIHSIISSEFRPEIVEREQVNLSLFDSIPFADLAVLGPAFVPMISSLQSIGSQLLGSNLQGTETLYRAKLPKGATSMFHTKDGFIGAARGTNGLGQTRFTPVEVPKGGVANNATPAPINPYMIAIAAALMSVNMKLNDIKKSQDNMMRFLEQKEQSILEGNLSFLSDILNNYKLNWNNERYISTNHIKVLDIKQESEQGIILFKKQVESVLDGKSLLHTTKKVNDNLNTLIRRFEDYRLSVYMYAFSSYVDVLLLENFDSLYLDNIRNKISNYALEYRETYTNVYAAFERYVKKSARSIAARGVSGVTKVLGSTVEKIPKLQDTEIDEKLLLTAENIKKWDIDVTDKTAKHLAAQQRVDVSLFSNSIQKISHLYNSPLELLISDNTLYIESA